MKGETSNFEGIERIGRLEILSRDEGYMPGELLLSLDGLLGNVHTGGGGGGGGEGCWQTNPVSYPEG